MRNIYYISAYILCLVCTACVDEAEVADTSEGNFEQLWKVMDEHYCFFSLKKSEYGIDWDEVHNRYKALMTTSMTRDQLFEHCCNMIGELRDGHVNLTSSFDYGREWSWKESYKTNYSDTLERKYLGTDYRITSGMKYRILDDNTGYIRLPSFENSIGDGNIDNILYYLMPCNSLIIDIRSNGGGMITSAETLARRFTDETITVGYMQHKTGTGHDDFSSMEEQRLEPSDGFRWHKKVYVLTNRGVYSAANEFTKYMRCCGATIIGDKTGGGAGMPFTSELPNGWLVRFSACPMYDINGNSTEQGIAPDIKVDLLDTDILRGEDTIIETARQKSKN